MTSPIRFGCGSTVYEYAAKSPRFGNQERSQLTTTRAERAPEAGQPVPGLTLQRLLAALPKQFSAKEGPTGTFTIDLSAGDSSLDRLFAPETAPAPAKGSSIKDHIFVFTANGPGPKPDALVQ
jgi:hypothetical protein